MPDRIDVIDEDNIQIMPYISKISISLVKCYEIIFFILI